ncbi:MAG: benzoate-CoA ligase family protein [Thermincola sp.]|jgi:benzoate-CoA ligase|nr:benzoate-CoA ligase family protein [Thermincola sp.]MDT3701818.1 benzoate-CoA ligase family protein [Thermincola sp.]
MAAPIIDVPDQLNIGSSLIDVPIQQGLGNKTAIICEDQVLTYEDVYNSVNKTGNLFINLGVLREQRVLLLLPDSAEFIFNLIGVMKMGAVAVPLNTMLKPKDYLYFLNDSRAAALVVAADYLPMVEEILDQARYLKNIIVVGKTDNPKHINYYKEMSKASPELEPADTSKDDPAFWLYSSGTTGQPKGTIHLHHDMLFAANYFDAFVTNLTPDDRIFSVSKLFFSYGNVNSLYLPFLAGATVILNPERPEAGKILEIITKHKPTIMFGVPTSYSSILKAVEQGDGSYDVSSIRLFVSAGENLPPSLWQKWKDRFGAEICDGIGSTEVGYIYISNRPGQIKPGSSGMALPGYELKIVDEDGAEVPLGQTGTLLVKGDGIAAGYWNKHHRTVKAFIGEWYVTGDRFSLDEDGFYWYTGRADDMVKVGGIWVSPIEVETLLLEHTQVEECAVVGQMDQNGLLKTAAYVVLKNGLEGSEEITNELLTHLRAKAAAYKVPRWIHFHKELPKTATGKVQRFKLRQSPAEK